LAPHQRGGLDSRRGIELNEELSLRNITLEHGVRVQHLPLEGYSFVGIVHRCWLERMPQYAH
jgi:hypothetical protein